MGDKNIVIQGDYYEQSGSLGAGHVSESEIKDKAKLGGIVNESEENDKSIPQAIEQKTNNKKTAETTGFLELTISGDFETTDLADILRIQGELLSKLKNIQKTNINIVDAEEGSIKLTFEGSSEELEQLKALIESGELTEVSGRNIEKVKLVDSETEERELRNKVNTRKQLVQEIRSKRTKGRKLGQIDLKFCDLKCIFLEKANLSGADLSFTNLIYADLRNANLIRADLRNANLIRADLIRADLRNANLIRADLRNANLRNANLRNVNLNSADLSYANLRNANLSYADLRNAKLISTKIDKKTKLVPKWRLVWEIINHGAGSQDLSGRDLSNAYLVRADLKNARLVQADLTYSKLQNANLSGANLIGADLRNTILLNANLTDADLSGAKVENAHFGYNPGISQSLKDDLIANGAIFEDSPGDRSEVLTRV